MATDLEKLVVQLSADIRGYDKALAKANGVTNRQFNAIERRARAMNKNLDGIFAKSFKGLAAPLAGLGAVLGTAQLIKLTDTWTDLNSRVKLAAGGTDEGAAAMERLSEVARRTYSGLEQTAEGYLLNATAMRELGYSTSDTLDYTESVNNALVISGAKGQRAEAVMNALSKAMAGGALKGDNLNTVIEQGGRLAEALADGLGVGVNELRALGTAGKITGRDIVGALAKQMELLRKEAEEMPATIGDGIQLLQNALLEYVGNADKATGVSARISEALVIMADNFDKTADAALQLAAVIAGALIGRSLALMIKTLGLAGTALISFTRALAAARTMGGLATAFGGLGAAAGPVGLLIGGAVVASLIAFSDSSSEASIAAKTYAEALAAVEAAAAKAAPAIEGVAASIDEKTKNALTGGLDEGKKAIEEAKAAVLDLFETLFTNVDRDTISPDQLKQLEDLRERLEKGDVAAGDAEQALFKLANSNPDFQAVADAFAPLLQALANAIAATDLLNGKLNSVGSQPSWADTEKKSMSALAGMEATNKAFIDSQTKQNDLSKKQLALETEIAKVRKDSLAAGATLTEKQIRDIATSNVAADSRRSGEGKKAKTAAPKKDADDRFDNLTQGIYDRIAALKIEADTTGLVFQEQEKRRMALDLEQEALKFVREEARKKGDQDWQNAKLTPDQIAKIDEVSEAYARQADALRLIEEAQDRAESAAGEFYSTFKSGMIDAITGATSFQDALSGILKKLAEMVLNSAFDSLFSGATGSGGWLTGIFKGAGFASGTANTGGVRGQPVGVVHGQEAVIPLPTGGKVPVQIQTPMMQTIGPAPTTSSGPSIVFAPTIDARGASVEAVERLGQELQKVKRDLPAVVDNRMATARSRNFKGR